MLLRQRKDKSCLFVFRKEVKYIPQLGFIYLNKKRIPNREIIMADTEQKPEETPATEEPKKTEEEKPVENGEEKKEEEAVADGEAKKEDGKEEEGATEEAVENHENGKEGEGAEEEEEETPAPSLEAPTENPFTDEDVQQLLDMETVEEGWDKVKEKKGAIVYRKAEKNSTPLIKVSLKSKIKLALRQATVDPRAAAV